jgi:hypothetical protein
MNDKTELKPCPFCGGEAKTSYHAGGNGGQGSYSTRCADWRCPSKTSSAWVDGAEKAWNTRAQDVSVAQASNAALDEAAAEMEIGARIMSRHGSETQVQCFQHAAKIIRALKNHPRPKNPDRSRP